MNIYWRLVCKFWRLISASLKPFVLHLDLASILCNQSPSLFFFFPVSRHSSKLYSYFPLADDSERKGIWPFSLKSRSFSVWISIFWTLSLNMSCQIAVEFDLVVLETRSVRLQCSKLEAKVEFNFAIEVSVNALPFILLKWEVCFKAYLVVILHEMFDSVC